jgi:hypothetical protein
MILIVTKLSFYYLFIIIIVIQSYKHVVALTILGGYSTQKYPLKRIKGRPIISKYTTKCSINELQGKL